MEYNFEHWVKMMMHHKCYRYIFQFQQKSQMFDLRVLQRLDSADLSLAW